MNRYILLRRIRGPIYLLTFGVTALLAEFHILSFDRSWPLYLIVAGLLALAERGLLATLPPPTYGTPGYGGYPAPSYPAPSYPGPNPPPAPGAAIVPATVTDIEGRL